MTISMSMAEVRSTGDAAETDAPLQSYVHGKQVVAEALRDAQGVLAQHSAGNDDRRHALLSLWRRIASTSSCSANSSGGRDL
jgi:hypothetical protein